MTDNKISLSNEIQILEHNALLTRDAPEFKSIYDYISQLSVIELLSFIRFFYPLQVQKNYESTFPVTEAAFNYLTYSEINLIKNSIKSNFGIDEFNSLLNWEIQNYPHYRREILRFGCNCEPELLWKKTKMLSANPPSSIHCMIRSEIFAGDLYSGDMVVAALKRSGFDFQSGMNYLDFGASSGSVVRNLLSYRPNAKWFACDPVESSIEWAQNNLKLINFSNSTLLPPLNYEQQIFDGVYAISIWSHFSEGMALTWFKEMHRIIKPGGFLVFTTHGLRSIYYYLEHNLLSRELMLDAFINLCGKGHFFQRVWQDGYAEDPLIDTKNWGNGYFTLNWVTSFILNDWEIADYSSGINQLNQDCYVLIRR